MARVLPGTKLEPIPLSHSIFSDVVPVQNADYTPAVAMRYGQLNTPKLEGITLNGDVRVIYSPIDLEAGWEPTEYPMAIAYRQDTAIAARHEYPDVRRHALTMTCFTASHFNRKHEIMRNRKQTSFPLFIS